MSSNETIVLLDGHSLVHRAYHAVRPLSNSNGEPTHAVYGFTSMLIKAIGELKPDYMAVTFDRSKPTFRHREFVEYKAQRPPSPEDLRSQFEPVRDVVTALDIPIYELDEYEADDLLGTLSRQAAEAGLQSMIVSGDADMLQLVNDSVRVMTPRVGFSQTVVYDVAAVQRRYGVLPSTLPDWKAIKGDPSDNIKGVAGIGDKGATRLLTQFGSIDGILSRMDEVDGRLAGKLAGQDELLRQNLRLATILCDAPIELDLDRCRFSGVPMTQTVQAFNDLEFRTLIPRLRNLPRLDEGPPAVGTFARGGQTSFLDTQETVVEGPAQGFGPVEIVDSRPQLEALASKLTAAGAFALDTETTGRDAIRVAMVGISVCYEPGRSYYIPLATPSGPSDLSFDDLREVLGPVFCDPKVAKYGHNAKYDGIVLAQAGIPVDRFGFDTMIAVGVAENPSRGHLGLKGLTLDRLGLEMTPIEDLIGKGKNQISMHEVPVEKVAPYAGADAEATFRLVDPLRRDLQTKEGERIFEEVEMPLVRVLSDMEMAGIAVNVQCLKEMSVTITQQLGHFEEKIYEQVGHPFKIGSTKQLAGVLFDELGLKGLRRTRTGYSTDANTLSALRNDHPVVPLILEHRQLAKLKSTYVDALPLMVNPNTNRVHTSYNQIGAATGRLSSTDPNLQNIPVRTELGRQVRKAFITESDEYTLLSADYSQIELRLLAHMTEDPNLIAAFNAGQDIHAATAGQVLGVPLDQVTSDMRRSAKAINFGIIYGISDYGLSVQLGIRPAEAGEFIRQYFARYPLVQQYLDSVIQQGVDEGYVSTMYGRRRNMPDLRASNRQIRSAAERAAINMPLQGAAADIIKLAMITLHEKLANRDDCRMLLQVHDELLFEVKTASLEEFGEIVRHDMENVAQLRVPIEVDLSSGPNWRDLK